MVLKSFAKVNLFLSVNKKLKNKLHDLQSVYCLIDLFDKITLKKNNFKSDQVYFRGPYSKYVKKSNNSVLKVLKIMRENKLISNYYSIKIFKEIPVFAGLGGGTSNAATVLKHLCKKKVGKKIFNKIVDYVGSYLRLFFSNQGYLKNLNKVYELQKKFTLYFLLVDPKILVSTKEVYSKVKKYSNKKKIPIEKLKHKKVFIDHLAKFDNDLQLIVEKKYPIISRLLADISKERGCFFSRMSGSGSACYGLFSDRNCSKVALRLLKKKYPKFNFSIAKTI